ncbi:MAG TPA: hypothetical protein VMT19_11720 [Thermoanaerobaculaceae bacterium]|nr:hypothetical protein [Thermoanaerobaculaceae bacterium]
MQVKGNILRARIAFVKERFGEAAWDRVVRTMTPSDQEQLSGVVNVGWYPFDLGRRLDDAIVGIVGGGRTTVFEEMGRASARENLTSVHSSFLEPRDPAVFMQKAAMIYRFYYDTGRRTWEATGPSSGMLTTYDADTHSVADCATVVGWYKEALAMLGARDVVIVEEACRARGNEFCRYVVSWS